MMCKNKIIKALITLLTLTLCFSVACYGADEQPWRNTQGAGLDAWTGTATGQGFEATIEDEILTMESSGGGMVSWELTNAKDLNESANGLTMKNTALIQPLEESVTVNGVEYQYTCTSFQGLLAEKAGGLYGLKGMQYVRLRNNEYQVLKNNIAFEVQKGKFTSPPDNVKLVVECFVPELASSNNSVGLIYQDKTGTNRSAKATISTANSWVEVSIPLSDINLTKTYKGNDNIDMSFNLSFGNQSATYIRSVKIVRDDSIAPSFIDGDPTNEVLIPVANDDEYGDLRIGFNLSLVDETADIPAWNAGTNSMIIGINNNDGITVAALLIESVASTQKFYALTTDTGGALEKALLFEGDYIGASLDCVLELKLAERGYAISVESDGEVVLSGDTTFNLANDPYGSVSSVGRSLTIQHNIASNDLKTVFKDFSFEIKDSVEFLNCKTDSESLSLGLDDNIPVTENFLLPTNGEFTSTTWESLDEELVTIEDDMAILHPTDKKKTVTLRATTTSLSNSSVSVVRTFSFVMAEHADYLRLMEFKENLEIEGIPDTGKVSGNLKLPIHEFIVGWTVDDDNDCVTISDDLTTALITRKAEDINVSIVAQLKIDNGTSFTTEKSFEFTVASVTDLRADVSEPAFIPVPGSENLYDVSITVNYPAIADGILNFYVVSVDPTTGEIRDKKSGTTEINDDNRFGEVCITAENFVKHNGDKVSTYLWTEDGVSIINNAPTDIEVLNATDVVKGVRLNWDTAYDDHGQLDCYEIYRNGTLVGTTTETEYLDTTANSSMKTYRVVAVDANGVKGDGNSAAQRSTRKMYSITYGLNNTVLNGFMESNFSENPAASAYAYITSVTDANGVVTSAAYTPNKNVYAKVDSKYIRSSDAELVFEIDYLDCHGPSGKLSLWYICKKSDGSVGSTYSIGVPQMSGTNLWKTVVIRINDANLTSTSLLSGEHFGVTSTVNSVTDEAYVKEIRVIQAEYYD